MRVTNKEKEFLKQIYIGNTDKEILIENLKITEVKLIKLEKRIFKKLAVNNWYNAIRISFELNILSREDFSTLDLNKEVIEAKENLLKIKFQDFKTDSIIKLLIFQELIELYNKYEYDVLLKKPGLSLN